jgi:hypothetical protein
MRRASANRHKRVQAVCISAKSLVPDWKWRVEMLRRTVWGIAFAFLLSACGQQVSDRGSESSRESTASDIAEAPSINPTAAPGVAFSYSYDFQLGDGTIAPVQEAHAAHCEALGVTRCRITGLRYSVGVNDTVSAMLQVKLAPDLARQFGKDATAEVRKADGRLVNTEFTGEDTAPAISNAQAQQSDVSARIADIEKRIANMKSGDRERAELQSQLETLRREAAEANATISTQREKLANTPMTFNYYGKGGIPGFGGKNPVREAAKTFVSSAVTMISAVLTVAAALLPWLVLLALIVAALRSRIGRRFVAWVRPRQSEEAEA